MALSKRVVLVCAPVAMLACSFDSDGLQTSSNSAGTLESSGSETSAEAGEGPSTSSPTGTSASTSMTSTGPQTTAPTDESSTTPPTTSETASESGDDPTTGDDPSASTGMSIGESSSSEGGSSSDTGIPSGAYGMCTVSADCGDGMCVTLYLDFDPSFHVCYPPCQEVEDCPAPSSGTATPTCTDSGCGLFCDGLTCPDGMECGYTDIGNRRCVWP